MGQHIEPTLADLIRRGVNSASDGLLASTAATGLVALACTLVWRPPASEFLACLALLATCFGAYGIADRELSAPVRDHSITGRRMLSGLRQSALGAGGIAGFALLLLFLTRVLGTWIS